MRRAAGVFGLVLVALVGPGCGWLGGARSAGGAVESPGLGAFTITSPVLGDRSVVPVACASGEHEIFFGADFVDPAAKLVVRLVVDPLEGPIARLFEQGQAYDRSVIVRRSECATFHAAMARTNVRIGGIRVHGVTLELDCRLADGTSVRGRAAATCS